MMNVETSARTETATSPSAPDRERAPEIGRGLPAPALAAAVSAAADAEIRAEREAAARRAAQEAARSARRTAGYD